MKKETKILITVSGGIVQDVSSNNPDVKIVIADHDDQSEDEVTIDGPKAPDHVADKLYAFLESAEEDEDVELEESVLKVIEYLKEHDF